MRGLLTLIPLKNGACEIGAIGLPKQPEKPAAPPTPQADAPQIQATDIKALVDVTPLKDLQGIHNQLYGEKPPYGK